MVAVLIIHKPRTAMVTRQVSATIGIEGFVSLFQVIKVSRGRFVEPIVHGGQVDVFLDLVGGVFVSQVVDFAFLVIAHYLQHFIMQLKWDEPADWRYCGLFTQVYFCQSGICF